MPRGPAGDYLWRYCGSYIATCRLCRRLDDHGQPTGRIGCHCGKAGGDFKPRADYLGRVARTNNSSRAKGRKPTALVRAVEVKALKARACVQSILLGVSVLDVRTSTGCCRRGSLMIEGRELWRSKSRAERRRRAQIDAD
jgi:hypothetical protein